ncbi:CaiB/BaiF CoA-transferase family protein [uncultured Serinicoccus sp.]|uniref:CaiB/BaiF CoA transferase family protein n=1 Tax=uncultured Serinicoccus sp. TaxID=735514 RepID=UPI0026288392|nr:CaiB/BaiF CoA-transferase family protein [uncultured Serinicoccus sp.]
MKPNAAPLLGVRVINFSRMAPGPFAARLLADLGADVVMIETAQPPSRDPDSFLANRARESGVHPLYRGVTSVCVDMKQADGMQRARQLALEADVLLESFRPGVMSRLGLGYESLSSDAPQMIYASLTGYGQDGDLASVRGHDLDFLAESGLLSVLGRKNGVHEVPLNIVADYAAGGLYGAYSILVALISRRQTQRGCYLDLSIVDNLRHLMAPAEAWLATSQADGDGKFFTGHCPFYNTYQAGDGKWLTITAVEPQSFSAMIDATGLEQHRGNREAEDTWPAMHGDLARWVRQGSRDEAVRQLRDADVPVGTVRSLAEGIRDQRAHSKTTAFPHPGYFRSETDALPRYTPKPGSNRPTSDITDES